MTYVFGLPHKFSVKRVTGESSDGAGGIAISYDWVFQNRDCRIAVLTAEDLTKWQGIDGQCEWQVVCEYSPELQQADVFVVGSETPAKAGDYRIFKFKHHIDENGSYDHTNVLLSKMLES